MATEPEMHGGQARLPLATKMKYGAGGAADNLLYYGTTSLFLPIFNVGYGLNAVMLGLAIGVPRLLDALTDPLMGNLSDNARTRWGRRRPFMLAGIVLSALSVILLFNPPRGMGESGLLWWFAIIGSLFFITYTAYFIPYAAWGLELSGDYLERTRVLSWRAYFNTAAGLAIPWLYPLCFMLGENETQGARVVMVLLACVALACGLVPVLMLKERIRPDADIQSMPFLPSLKSALRNRPFLWIALAQIGILLGLFISIPLTLYLGIFHIFSGNKPEAAAFGAISGTLAMVASIFGYQIGTWLAARVGKRHAVNALAGLCIAAAVSTWWLYIPGNPWPSVIPGICISIGASGSLLVIASMVGEVCDADELETGCRREGIFSASMEFGKKCAIAFSTLVGGYVLAATGFDEKVTVQSVETVFAMRWGCITVISAAMVLVIAAISKYPIDRRRAREISHALEARRGTNQFANQVVIKS